MSTADFTLNAWMQSENTLAAAPAWTDLDADLEDPHSEPREQPVREPAPTLPDDLWQEWFGIWR
jgi:hypothetical protein